MNRCFQIILVLCWFLSRTSSASGELLWSEFIAGEKRIDVLTAVDDAGLLILHPQRNALVFYTTSGEVAWETAIPWAGYSSASYNAVAYQNNKFFCSGSYGGNVVVVDVDGAGVGSFSPPGSSSLHYTSPALAGNDFVAVGSTGGKFHGIDINDIDESWVFQGEWTPYHDFDYGEPGIVSMAVCGRIICLAFPGRNLYSLNQDGTKFWELELPSYVYGEIVIDNLNNIILAMPYRGSVICISSDGVIKWEVQLPSGWMWESNIIVDEVNNFYILCGDANPFDAPSRLFKISAKGEIVWEKRFPRVGCMISLCSDQKILLLDTWKLLKVDSLTGDVAETINLGVSIPIFPSVVLSNSGILYVTSYSSARKGSTIYAINTGSESAAYSSWSQYRGNAGRTGGVLSQDGILPDRWKEGIVRRLGSAVTAEDLLPDGDADKDGLSNIEELRHGVLAWNPDTDGDGMPDGWEVEHGLNPADPSDAFVDTNYDGVLNVVKYQFGLNPNLIDSNGDGKTDAWFVNQHKHLLDTDGDGLPDQWEIEHGLNPYDAADALIDSNENGVINLDEFAAGTNPHEIFLAAGWNLISVVRAMKFGEMPERGRTIWKWDGVTSTYVQVCEGDYLLPVYGYWVYVLEDTFFDSTNP